MDVSYCDEAESSINAPSRLFGAIFRIFHSPSQSNSSYNSLPTNNLDQDRSHSLKNKRSIYNSENKTNDIDYFLGTVLMPYSIDHGTESTNFNKNPSMSPSVETDNKSLELTAADQKNEQIPDREVKSLATEENKFKVTNEDKIDRNTITDTANESSRASKKTNVLSQAVVKDQDEYLDNNDLNYTIFSCFLRSKPDEMDIFKQKFSRQLGLEISENYSRHRFNIFENVRQWNNIQKKVAIDFTSQKQKYLDLKKKSELEYCETLRCIEGLDLVAKNCQSHINTGSVDATYDKQHMIKASSIDVSKNLSCIQEQLKAIKAKVDKQSRYSVDFKNMHEALCKCLLPSKEMSKIIDSGVFKLRTYIMHTKDILHRTLNECNYWNISLLKLKNMMLQDKKKSRELDHETRKNLKKLELLMRFQNQSCESMTEIEQKSKTAVDSVICLVADANLSEDIFIEDVKELEQINSEISLQSLEIEDLEDDMKSKELMDSKILILNSDWLLENENLAEKLKNRISELKAKKNEMSDKYKSIGITLKDDLIKDILSYNDIKRYSSELRTNASTFEEMVSDLNREITVSKIKSEDIAKNLVKRHKKVKIVYSKIIELNTDEQFISSMVKKQVETLLNILEKVDERKAIIELIDNEIDGLLSMKDDHISQVDNLKSRIMYLENLITSINKLIN